MDKTQRERALASILVNKGSDFLTEEEKAEIIKSDCFLIRLMKNPSVALRKQAVEKFGSLLKYFPEEDDMNVLMAAAMNDGMSVKFMKSPIPINVQCAAIKNNVDAYNEIKNPSKEAIDTYRLLYWNQKNLGK